MRLFIFLTLFLISNYAYSENSFTCEYQDQWRHYTFTLNFDPIWAIGTLKLSAGKPVKFQTYECHSAETYAICQRSPAYGSNIQCDYQVFINRVAQSEYLMTISFTDCKTFQGKYFLQDTKCTGHKGELKISPR